MTHRTIWAALFALALSTACGDDVLFPIPLPDDSADVGGTSDAGDADAGDPTDGASDGVSTDGTDTEIACDEAVRAGSFAVNIVDPAAADELERALVFASDAHLRNVTARYYDYFDDDVDFLFVFPAREVPEGVAGSTEIVFRPAMPWLGLSAPVADSAYGSDGTLRSAIMMNFHDGGNGPTLHEVLHWWGVFFDDRFGFGRDADAFYGSHWGVAGVAGQLGGFAPETLRCVDPPGAVPPCDPAPDGGFVVTTAGFQAAANNDGAPYAPIELYLMGLLPASDVPGPFPVMPDASFESYDQAADRITFRVPEILSVSLDDIIAFHGEAPEAAADERSFRAAFVMISAEPASAEAFGRLENWAGVFGGEIRTDWLYSFESATSGLASMDVVPGPTRADVAPACPALTGSGLPVTAS